MEQKGAISKNAYTGSKDFTNRQRGSIHTSTETSEQNVSLGSREAMAIKHEKREWFTATSRSNICQGGRVSLSN